MIRKPTFRNGALLILCVFLSLTAAVAQKADVNPAKDAFWKIPNGTIQGRIVFEGTGISKAKVTFQNIEVSPDSAGLFVLAIPEGILTTDTVHISASNFLPLEVPLLQFVERCPVLELKAIGTYSIATCDAGVAGSRVLRGVLTDATSGEFLPFVNVRVDSLSLVANSDFDGYWEIQIPDSIQLKESDIAFAFVGYQDLLLTNIELHQCTHVEVQLEPVIWPIINVRGCCGNHYVVTGCCHHYYGDEQVPRLRKWTSGVSGFVRGIFRRKVE